MAPPTTDTLPLFCKTILIFLYACIPPNLLLVFIYLDDWEFFVRILKNCTLKNSGIHEHTCFWKLSRAFDNGAYNSLPSSSQQTRRERGRENVCLEIDTQRKLAFVHLAQNWGEIKAKLNHLDANYCRHWHRTSNSPHQDKKTYFCWKCEVVQLCGCGTHLAAWRNSTAFIYFAD